MEQRTPEWFAARRGRITASSVGAILGNSPYASRADVMRRMVREYHGAENEFTGNIATEYGVNNEAGALTDFRLETGADVQQVGFIDKDDWAGCSPDGLIGELAGLEIKCPFSKRKDAKPVFKTIEEQPHYRDQIQFSMWVAGRPIWYFYQWAPGGTDCKVVMMLSSWQDENLPKLRQFYAEYLDAIAEPADHLGPLRVQVDTPDAAKMLREYDEMSDAIERATARKAAILIDFATMSNHRDAEVCGRKFTSVERVGAVSYAKAIKELAPDADLEKWRGKPSRYWKLG